MKNLKLALMGVCLAWTAQAAYADDCYTDDLMAYVDSRIPSGNQTERRWESIKAALLEQEGAMTLERAEEILEARRSRGLPLEHMDEVVEAIKCIANKPEEGEVEPEPEDPPQPLNTEPQQANVKQLRVYFNGPLPASSNVEYRINEDDHWESELIIHYKTNQDGNAALNGALCVNHDIWRGDNHWNNGPIMLPGFNTTADLKTGISPTHDLYGLWQCTDSAESESTITVLNPDNNDDDDIAEFVYRATVRIRDNNVVENDFSIADDLEFRYNVTYSGKSKFNPETETVPDRAAWRLLENEEAFPDSAHTTYCLGTGSAWERFTPLRCGDQVASKYLDRAPVVGGSCSKTHSDYTVRADVSDEAWMPDNCYPTKDVVQIPPTSSNTNALLDNTELPIIEEDDVSWISLRKKNGKWTVSLSKPVMVTDGTRIVGSNPNAVDHENSAHGLTLTMSGIPGYTTSYKQVHLLIPAENGIVMDKDYPLADLKRIANLAGWHPPEGVESFGESCQSTRAIDLSRGIADGFHGKYALSSTKLNTYVRNNTLSSRPSDKKSLEMDLPPDGSNLCN